MANYKNNLKDYINLVQASKMTVLQAFLTGMVAGASLKD